MGSIADGIKAIRVDAGMTQKEFGAVVGVSEMAVSQWENSRAVPRMKTLQAIAARFGVKEGDILDGCPHTARNILALLSLEGIDQETLARIVDVSQAAVSGWVNGTKRPSIASVEKICSHFGLEPNDILSDANGLAAQETDLERRCSMGIAQNIKAYRQKADLTQEQLADKIGVARSTVTQWETGWSQPRMGMVKKLADAFSIDPSVLVSEGDASKLPMNGRPMAASEPAFLPLLRIGTMHSGDPDECYEQGEEVMVPAEVVQEHPNAFVMRNNGNCMDKVILDGMDGVIDPDIPPKRGDPALVQFEGGETVLRCYFPFKDMVVLSPSSHEEFEDIVIRAEDNVPFRVLGSLVWRQGAV